jgi:small conductance mechanosensitive channel
MGNPLCTQFFNRIGSFVHWLMADQFAIEMVAGPYAKKGNRSYYKTIFTKPCRRYITCAADIGVVQIMGVPITLFTALVGAFGVAAGLALSGTLQNFASGVLILLLKPFVVGDNIIAQGLEGSVTSIQIFYTIVKTFDNRIVIIPNSKLSNEVIINISREGTRRLDIELKFANNIDYNEVKSVINSSIDKSKNILETPDRRIGIAGLDSDGYRVGVNVWVHAHGFQDTKLAVQENILQDLKASGIKIPGL